MYGKLETRLSQYCGGIKRLAASKVRAHYNLMGKHSDIKERIMKLREHHNYIYPVDKKVCIFLNLELCQLILSRANCAMIALFSIPFS